MRTTVRWLGLLLVLSLVLAHENDDDEEAVVVEDVGQEDGIHVERVEMEDIAYFSPDSHPDHFFADHFDDEETYQEVRGLPGNLVQSGLLHGKVPNVK